MVDPTAREREIACEILRSVFIHGLGAPCRLNDPESVERIAKILAVNRHCQHMTNFRAGVEFCMLANRNQSLHDDMADFCESDEIAPLWHEFKIKIKRI